MLGKDAQVIVVSDAGPLHYLIKIGKIDLLRIFFGEVLVPRSVREELMHINTPVEVRTWFASPPAWVAVASVTLLGRPLPLGKGESEAIRLAQDQKADLILLDDKKARRIAEEHGLAVTGTLGILLAAHRRGLVRMLETIQELVRSGFRLSEKLANQMIANSNAPLDEIDKDQ
jgi:predicted nucleic acid-binding protein